MKEKYTASTGAAAGSFQPFAVDSSELVLTAVHLKNVEVNDHILLKIVVGWEKPIEWDTGELEIMIRYNSPDGPIVYWTLETCFEKAVTAETHSIYSSVYEQPTYYLTVKSPDRRARITGPYTITAAVLKPEK